MLWRARKPSNEQALDNPRNLGGKLGGDPRSFELFGDVPSPDQGPGWPPGSIREEGDERRRHLSDWQAGTVPGPPLTQRPARADSGWVRSIALPCSLPAQEQKATQPRSE